MLDNITIQNIYLLCGTTDLRKSIDGLASIVQFQLKKDPFEPALFIFCNTNRNKLKILFWEHNGFWLYYRRLEKGRFKWVYKEEEKSVSIFKRQLNYIYNMHAWQDTKLNILVMNSFRDFYAAS